MENFKTLFQDADWKKEKHVPVIEILEQSKAQEIKLMISVGKEIPHPNKTEHHIRWIEVYFKPDNENFPYQLGRFEFDSHGASIKGPDTSAVYTNPIVVVSFKTQKEGTIYASSYCNIHGLWENSLKLKMD